MHYDKWARSAYISANVLNANSGKGKKYKVSDLIKHPREEREKKAMQNKVDLTDKDKLRELAKSKGIDVPF